jgi:hypothetical protein
LMRMRSSAPCTPVCDAETSGGRNAETGGGNCQCQTVGNQPK